MKLRIPRDQLLAFGQELLEAARSFLSIKDPSYSQATLARARATPETAQGCERVRRRDCANAYVVALISGGRVAEAIRGATARLRPSTVVI